MSWLTNIFSNGISSAIGKAGELIDNFHLSEEEKQQFTLEMQKILNARDNAIEKTIQQEIESREKVMVTELNQGDNYTKRARPSVVYFGLAIISVNYIVVPLLIYLSGKPQVQPFSLPTEFWLAWSGVVSTWSIGRSVEKTKGFNKYTKGITGSKHYSLLND
ncbi:3TM-type holin [Spartinivicinus poritis]|uniref:3TM-type holin n=1 Tax=Spartinivicinus poritis TaxID=2994640 RepID=A0ABT5UI07_9GAMM|nr:3TM-type holin [Spartinivicinus sp. A2-2]MDE1466030.1 3TM-type holin [Spartinivicinus sp. A2-2]